METRSAHKKRTANNDTKEQQARTTTLMNAMQIQNGKKTTQDKTAPMRMADTTIKKEAVA